MHEDLRNRETAIAPKETVAIAGKLPKDILDTNFFLGAIRNIIDTKVGAPFFETSPQLHSILEGVRKTG